MLTEICIAESNCKHSSIGTEFLGFINISTSGKTCLKWKDFDDILLPYINDSVANNYCRIASPRTVREIQFTRPWCYTLEGPELCDIPYCGERY